MAQRQRNAIPGCLHPGPYTCKASQVKRAGRLQLCRQCYDKQRTSPLNQTDYAKKLVKFIREHPYATYADIAEHMDISVRSVPQSLLRLQRRKLIRHRLQWEAVE